MSQAEAAGKAAAAHDARMRVETNLFAPMTLKSAGEGLQVTFVSV